MCLTKRLVNTANYGNYGDRVSVVRVLEFEEKVKNGQYPRGAPLNPVNKDEIPETEEFQQLIKQLEELGIKTQ